MSNRRSPEQWRSILSAFHRSGQTQAQFSRARGLSIATLRYQLQRERSRAIDPTSGESRRLLELTPIPAAQTGVSPTPNRDPVRVECSLGLRTIAIECQLDQIPQLLADLSTFDHQRDTPS
jgi:hypothetical protein